MRKIRTTNHKITAALLVAVMMLSVIFTAVFSGGVKANAALTQDENTALTQGEMYKHDFSGGNVSSDGFFTISGAATSGSLIGNYENALKLASEGSIIFKPLINGKITVVCSHTGKKGSKTIKVTKSTSTTTDSITIASPNKAETIDYSVEANVQYTLSKGSGESRIYSISYTPNPQYTINVVDGDDAKSAICEEGTSYTLTANNKDSFDYWVNSEGVIVSREYTKKFTAYYSETYTAVYKESGATVNYLTSYGTVLYTFTYTGNNIDAFAVPSGPILYGNSFDKWDTDVEAVKAKLKEGDSFDVKPVYSSASGEGYEFLIGINTKAFDGGSSTSGTYSINTPVTASINDETFAYWRDAETKKILSYSPTYSFLANKSLTVEAVKNDTDSSIEANKKAVITTVDKKTAVDGKDVIIFEYNVPSTYDMNFAGVIASKNKDSVNIAVGDKAYKLGESDLSCATYTYTVTKTTGTPWYVMPILTYTVDGLTYTITGDVIEF